MSGIDGREICRQIKSNLETSSIKVLLMSALPNSFELSEAVEADGHIFKPFEIDEFAGLVKQMLA